MAVMKVVQLTPELYHMEGICLRLSCTPILDEELKEKWFEGFITNMFETLYSFPSGVGLAANQVGVLRRVCVIDIKRDAKSPLVLINPLYRPLSEKTHVSDEVCLSFPNVHAPVERYDEIEVTYLSLSGEMKTITATGFKANVFQHEIDHLNGLPYIDKVLGNNSIGLYDGYQARLAQRAMNIISNDKGADQYE